MSNPKVLPFPAKRNSTGPESVTAKQIQTSKYLTGMLQCTRDSILFAWHRGATERNLAIAYGIPREAVENVLREQVNRRFNERRAA